MTLLVAGFLAGCAFVTECVLMASGVRYTGRRRPDLAERLLPYRPHVADEVEVWLRDRLR